MKKLSLILCFILISITLTGSRDISKAYNFTLSDNELELKIEDIAQEAAKDLNLSTTPLVSCYYYDWSVIASTSLTPVYEGKSVIYVNLYIFRNNKYRDLDRLLVFSTAHEVRHVYQYEHKNDETDYGKLCKDGFTNYHRWSDDICLYYSQFIEQDANTYAREFADWYFRTH